MLIYICTLIKLKIFLSENLGGKMSRGVNINTENKKHSKWHREKFYNNNK